jgi:transposase
MRKSTVHLHLKECEFWFNHRGKNLYILLIKIIRENPLF